MQAQAVKKMYSQEEYLELERAAEYKSEYYRGEIFAMSGGGLNHNQIIANLSGEIYIALKGTNCGCLTQDMRVHIPENTLYTYPDLLIACGEPELLDDHADTLLNPIVVIEVLSPSTAKYDRTKKFELYTGITSLREYILVDSRKIAAEVFYKTESDKWELSAKSYDLAETIRIEAVGLTLKMSDIYSRTFGLK